jgi:hypothetical protein
MFYLSQSFHIIMKSNFGVGNSEAIRFAEDITSLAVLTCFWISPSQITLNKFICFTKPTRLRKYQKSATKWEKIIT